MHAQTKRRTAYHPSKKGSTKSSRPFIGLPVPQPFRNIHKIPSKPHKYQPISSDGKLIQEINTTNVLDKELKRDQAEHGYKTVCATTPKEIARAKRAISHLASQENEATKKRKTRDIFD